METIGIDLETYSSVPIEYGVYRYTEAPDFEIMLLAYSRDGGVPTVVDLTALSPESVERWKALVREWCFSGKYRLTAYNAAFEIQCLSTWLGEQIPFEPWWDTMITAATVGLPRHLKDVGVALGLPEDKLKDRRGAALIRYFCVPCKPTKANGMRTRNRPLDAADKWQEFIEYNRQDVVSEQAIRAKLQPFEPSEEEHQAWIMSEEINRRGVLCDRKMAENAVKISQEHTNALMDELRELTGLDNPNSVSQLKTWLDMETVTKDTVASELKVAEGDRKRVLQLRQELGKTSVKKYQAMIGMMSDKDDRCRGVFKFYGANRTGRFTASVIQLQNMPQNHLEPLAEARQLVVEGDREGIEAIFGNVPDTLSQLIRTAFIPKPGYTFAVADFSAIEARVVAWLANEKWRMDLFAAGGDIYCQSASKMFGVPVEKHGRNAELRQRGKVAELACFPSDTLVMTDHGEIPITAVSKDMLLWDGEEWVHHDGVIGRGIKPVITYEGLTATPDHLVYVTGCEQPIAFATIKANRLTMKEYDIRSKYQDWRITYGDEAYVYDILNAGPRHRFVANGVLVHNCGYGGSVGAMINMGGEKLGLTEEELSNIVQKWREASPHIVDMWWDIDKKVKRTIKTGIKTETVRGIEISRSRKILTILLPSGRPLRYFDPAIGENKFGGECVTYQGYEEGKWMQNNSYGPKFVENITQAVSRDCLVTAMTRVARRYPDIVMHVHDEMIVEVPKAEAEEALAYMCECMAEPIDWAPGLILRGDGYLTDFYRKD